MFSGSYKKRLSLFIVFCGVFKVFYKMTRVRYLVDIHQCTRTDIHEMLVSEDTICR